MAELADILASGTIPKVEGVGLYEDGNTLEDVVFNYWSDGYLLPEVSGPAAALNSVFYNTDTDLVSWKSHGGTVLRFQLSL